MQQKPAQEHDQPCLGTVLTAPKARAIPAWGEAPCTRPDNVQGLKARSIHNSIPQIPFIEFHPIFREKCAKFILKILLSMIGRAGQSYREMNVVRDSTYAKTLAIRVTSDGSKIRVEGGANGRIEDGRTVLCAENNVNQNKRERLRHRTDYRSDFQPSYSTPNRTWGFTPCWYKGAPLALSQFMKVALVLYPLLPLMAHAQSPPLHIRIINAQTNKPIPNERLNVALRTDQIGSVAMATDKNGIISVDYGNATIIRILANMYADCRPRGELYTNYPIDTILKTGITTGNLCSSAQPKAHPGQLILFEIPKTYIPVFPAPPNSTLPHSDENPHQPQN